MKTVTHSPEETRAAATAWGAGLGPGTVIRLHGGLGAGKTTFVQGLARGLGYTGDATSPTFALLHEYPGSSLTLFHWDLYRLGPETDWSVLDLADQLPGPGITVVEWPERYPGPWPAGTLDIHLRTSEDDTRTIDYRGT
jgi:tRNA threonylcarbamoyladenosine biosynthesis protein TsaE